MTQPANRILRPLYEAYLIRHASNGRKSPRLSYVDWRTHHAQQSLRRLERERKRD